MERRELTNAEHARTAFLVASYITPSSPTGQAARIAEWCKRYGLEPKELERDLLANEGELERIRSNAVRQHASHGKGPLEIELSSVKIVVASDFTLAGEMMCLPVSDLRRLRGSLFRKSRALGLDRQGAETILEREGDKLLAELIERDPKNPQIPYAKRFGAW